ncbi:MAG: sugar ABC transporter permease [bacterium]
MQASATGPLPFQRTLRYAAHPDRAGQPLDPSRDDDKAAADAFTAATHGAGTDWELPAGRRAAARVEAGGLAGAVALVDRPHPPHPGAPVLALLAAALAGFLLWIVVLRRFVGRAFAPALGATLAAAPILGVLAWSTRRLADAFPVAGPAELAGDLALLFAAALAPLVAGAVIGVFSGGRRSPHRVAYAYVVPAMAGMAALVLVPFGLGVALAFTRHHAGTFTWVGLDNFVDILSGGGQPLWAPLSFYFTLVVTLLWTGLNVALHLSIGLGLALLLKDPDLRFKGLYRVLLIVPWAVPNYITALIWKGMFNKQYGLINEVLGLVGVEPVGWFSSFWTAFAANLTTNTWLGFPFMMVVALGALQSIPQDLQEAAEVDGAGRWMRFRHITLPLLKPALFPAFILGSIWTFNMFNIIYLVSGGQPEGATDILITEAYRWAFEQDRHGYAAAYSVLIFFILLAWSLLTQRASRGAEEAHG